MSRIKPARDEVGKAVRFGVVGVGATLTHLAVAQTALAVGLSPLIANVIGFTMGFLTGLLGHHHFTFPGTGPFGRAFRRYGVIALAGFGINNAVLLGLEATGRVSPQFSLTVAILIVPALSFIASRYWGFASSHPKEDQPEE